MRISLQFFFFTLLLVTSFSLVTKSSAKNKKALKFNENIANYPLFDTEYKMAANYLPILGLRALSHAKVFKDKKSFHIERFFYVKELSGEYNDPYETLILDGKASGHGLLGRRIEAHGKLNDFDISYENIMGFSLPKRAHMRVNAKLENFEILNLEIRSDGDDMTNLVTGSFMGKETNYKTEWRDTHGLLAGQEYKVFTQGSPGEEADFKGNTKGNIAEYEISGDIKSTNKNHYQSSENYGPIHVKTFIIIRD